jgi:hypothetical protein
LTANAVSVGAASLFSDSSHEMVTSLLPTFLTTTLSAAVTPVALFELGNVASTLLILRATELLQTDGRASTAATSLTTVLYAAHNGAASLAAIGGGHLADRFTSQNVFTAGAAAYAIGYAVFAVGWFG